jgi:hypothetical protein
MGSQFGHDALKSEHDRRYLPRLDRTFARVIPG